MDWIVVLYHDTIVIDLSDDYHNDFDRNWTVLAVSNVLLTIITIVLSLLLVFKNNAAYDKFNQGRLAWSTVRTVIRNLSRFTW